MEFGHEHLQSVTAQQHENIWSLETSGDSRKLLWITKIGNMAEWNVQILGDEGDIVRAFDLTQYVVDLGQFEIIV